MGGHRGVVAYKKGTTGKMLPLSGASGQLDGGVLLVAKLTPFWGTTGILSSTMASFVFKCLFSSFWANAKMLSSTMATFV